MIRCMTQVSGRLTNLFICGVWAPRCDGVVLFQPVAEVFVFPLQTILQTFFKFLGLASNGLHIVA